MPPVPYQTQIEFGKFPGEKTGSRGAVTDRCQQGFFVLPRKTETASRHVRKIAAGWVEAALRLRPAVNQQNKMLFQLEAPPKSKVFQGGAVGVDGAVEVPGQFQPFVDLLESQPLPYPKRRPGLLVNQQAASGGTSNGPSLLLISIGT
jgi:hypothetical protein